LSEADRRGKRDFSERIQGINGYYVGGERNATPLVRLAKTGREINVRRVLGISFSPETHRGCVPLAAQRTVVNLFVICIKFWPSLWTHATWSNCLAKLLYRTVKELPSTSSTSFRVIHNDFITIGNDIKIKKYNYNIYGFKNKTNTSKISVYDSVVADA